MRSRLSTRSLNDRLVLKCRHTYTCESTSVACLINFLNSNMLPDTQPLRNIMNSKPAMVITLVQSNDYLFQLNSIHIVLVYSNGCTLDEPQQLEKFMNCWTSIISFSKTLSHFHLKVKSYGLTRAKFHGIYGVELISILKQYFKFSNGKQLEACLVKPFSSNMCSNSLGQSVF